jgi:hypothetical protein
MRYILYKIVYLIFLFLPLSAFAVESHDGFLISAYDDRFKVISPEKFKTPMEIIVENKTLVRLVGKITINHQVIVSFSSVDSEKYQRIMVNLKKGDILHFVPLSPAFQEVELVVGNKTYEIPPKK